MDVKLWRVASFAAQLRAWIRRWQGLPAGGGMKSSSMTSVKPRMAA